MTIEHKDLTDPQLHEPKGIATAQANQVYVANGVGSGSWSSAPNNVPPATSEFKGTLAMANGNNGAEWGLPVWKDLIGDITPKTSGVGAPTLSNLRGNIRGFAYSVGDDGDVLFHLPHDYVPGTDLFLHVHWTHNGTAISGTFTTTCYVTYAKGHSQATFPAEITAPISAAGVALANTPQYSHRIDEIQLSAASPTAAQLNSALLEPDGIIAIHYDVTAIPTITGGTPNEPYILFFDLHYQAGLLGTANKAPNFYA